MNHSPSLSTDHAIEYTRTAADTGERDRVVRSFNETTVAYPKHSLIHELFEAQVKRSPNATATSFDDEELTYAQLNARANSLAHQLLAENIKPEMRVGICVERSSDTIAAYLGVLKTGAAYVPLDPSYPFDRLRFMLRDSTPFAVIAQRTNADRLATLGAKVIIPMPVDDTARENPRIAGLTPRNLAYVIYTSGSTGTPKGVLIEHRSVVRLVIDVSYAQINEADCVAHCSSPSFDATTWEVWSALLNGGRLLIVPREIVLNPTLLNSTLQKHHVTAMWLTVGLFNEYVDALESAFGQLRYLLIGGDALNESTVYRALSKPKRPQFLINGYGPTETTTFACTYILPPHLDRGAPIPIGRPINNTKIYILNDLLEPVPIGCAGEIFIGGDGVARGYLNNPSTSERFLPDPFVSSSDSRIYRSGDVGRWRHDGNVEYLGRQDSQIKLRGFRVELSGIERVLENHPNVTEALVTVQESSTGEKSISAYVTADRRKLKEKYGELKDGVDAIEHWRTLYEQMYEGSAFAPSFVGWNSSYTGDRIPEDEMTEWLDATVNRILNNKPHKVLEIGCGVGLLIDRIAPTCEVYVGTDFSEQAINHLRGFVKTRADLQHVTLKTRSATEICDVQVGNFDTIILNSVVQYFPDVEYLTELIKRCVAWTMPSGRVFIGDVRHFGMVNAFHTSVQLLHAPASLTADELRHRIARAVELDKELLVSPDYFRDLSRVLGCTCTALLKRGRADNELTRYRYDVIMDSRKIASEKVPLRIAANDTQTWVADLEATINASRPAIIQVPDIGNSRVARDILAAKIIAESPSTRTVESINHELKAAHIMGHNPEDIWRLGASLGYDVEIYWSPGRSDGRFCVELTDAQIMRRGECESIAKNSIVEMNGFQPSRHHANDPLGFDLRQRFASALREYASQKLAPFEVPSSFTVLDEFPLTQNGKVDRARLPLPDSRRLVQTPYAEPTTSTEVRLRTLWSQLLKVEQIGIDDNFFALGGHSLLGMKLSVLISNSFNVRVPALITFDHPTIRRMARIIEPLGLGTDNSSQDDREGGGYL